jgi:hypothetical protein
MGATFAQQFEVERSILVAEEHRLAAVAPLRDMVRGARDDDAGETGHAAKLARPHRIGN